MSTNSAALTGLSPDTAYEVMVAQGAGGIFAWRHGPWVWIKTPSATFASPRIAPTGLTVSNLTQNSLTLNWSRNNGLMPSSDLNTGCEVYQSGVKIGDAGTGSTFNVTGLTTNTSYSFKVRNTWGAAPTTSEFSNEITVTPVFPPSAFNPTNLFVANTFYTGTDAAGTRDFHIILQWTENQGSNTRVEFKQSTLTTWTTLATLSGTTNTYDSGWFVSAATNFIAQYRVFNTVGGVDYSNIVQQQVVHG
jgi:chitin-binding protein